MNALANSAYQALQILLHVRLSPLDNVSPADRLRGDTALGNQPRSMNSG